MSTIVKYVPVGLETDDTSMLIHETVEDFLYNNWSDADIVPRNKIRFNYKVDQNVGVVANNAIKCYDLGSEQEEYTSANDSVKKEFTNVKVTIETRSINNLSNDVPIELFRMKQKIRDVINGNRTGLTTSGIHLMTLSGNDAIERDPSNNAIYRMNLNIRCMQLMEKRVIVV